MIDFINEKFPRFFCKTKYRTIPLWQKRLRADKLRQNLFFGKECGSIYKGKMGIGLWKIPQQTFGFEIKIFAI